MENIFTISGVNFGQFKSLVEFLMLQMDIDNPIEVVRRINDGDWVVCPKIQFVDDLGFWLEQVDTISVESADFLDQCQSRANIGKTGYTFSRFAYGEGIDRGKGSVEVAVCDLKIGVQNAPLLTKLGRCAAISLPHFYGLIEQQSKGEDGPLLVDGSSNIVYVNLGKTLAQFAAYAIWEPGDKHGDHRQREPHWCVGFEYIGDQLEHKPPCRVFYRVSKKEPGMGEMKRGTFLDEGPEVGQLDNLVEVLMRQMSIDDPTEVFSQIVSGDWVAKEDGPLLTLVSSKVAFNPVSRSVGYDYLREINVLSMDNEYYDEFRLDSRRSDEGVNINVYNLSVPARDVSIWTELGEGADVSLGHFLGLIEQQSKGEDGLLLIDGSPNIAYVCRARMSKTPWAIEAVFCAREQYSPVGWHLKASQLGSKSEHCAGTRIISCAS